MRDFLTTACSREVVAHDFTEWVRLGDVFEVTLLSQQVRLWHS